MGIDDVETFQHWTYNPESDSFSLPGALGGTTLGLFELSAGRLRTSGNRVVESATGKIVGNITTTSEAFLEVGSQGTIFLSNVRSTRQLVDAMGTNRLPRLVVNGDLSPFGDTPEQPINRMITLAPRGAVIYVNDRIPSGKARYTRVDTGVFGGAPPPKQNEFGRLATAEDLIRRGVAGWLARNAEAALELLKVQGMELEDGTITTNGSDIVNAIAATVTVTPIVTYILQESFQP